MAALWRNSRPFANEDGVRDPAPLDKPPASLTWCFPGGPGVGMLTRMLSATEIAVFHLLLAVCAGCLLVLAAVALWSARCLRRITMLLEAGVPSVVSPIAAATDTGAPAARGEFETFLTEDPARRQLTKGEQFSAYRRWRQEKGLNWSKP